MPDSRDQTTNATDGEPKDSQWPLWEVFLQRPNGAAHEHAGSVHAVNAEQACENGGAMYM